MEFIKEKVDEAEEKESSSVKRSIRWRLCEVIAEKLQWCSSEFTTTTDALFGENNETRGSNEKAILAEIFKDKDVENIIEG